MNKIYCYITTIIHYKVWTTSFSRLRHISIQDFCQTIYCAVSVNPRMRKLYVKKQEHTNGFQHKNRLHHNCAETRAGGKTGSTWNRILRNVSKFFTQSPFGHLVEPILFQWPILILPRRSSIEVGGQNICVPELWPLMCKVCQGVKNVSVLGTWQHDT